MSKRGRRGAYKKVNTQRPKTQENVTNILMYIYIYISVTLGSHYKIIVYEIQSNNLEGINVYSIGCFSAAS